MPVDRDTARIQTAYAWSEVIRHARSELELISPDATDYEREMLGRPVHISWVEPNGERGSALGILVCVDKDSARYAVTDDGMGFNTETDDFAMRPATLYELIEMKAK